MLHRGHAEQPTASPPLNRRTRVVAAIVVGFLVVHVLAVLSILYVAKWAAADTETRQAHLQWAFPKAEVLLLPAIRPGVAATKTPASMDWLGQAHRKDASAPWSYDHAGNVVWK